MWTFRGEIKRFAVITELDEAVLNRLINRIPIGKPEKIDEKQSLEQRFEKIPARFLSKIRHNAKIPNHHFVLKL